MIMVYIIAIFLTLSNCHAMEGSVYYDEQTQFPRLLVDEVLLHVKKFAEHTDSRFIKLKTVLSFFHQDSNGFIVGRNANRLRFLIMNSLSYWEGDIYKDMLLGTLKLIQDGPVKKGSKVDLEACPGSEDCVCHRYPATDLEGSENCMICQSPLERVIAFRSCIHSFCYECIFMWYANKITHKDRHTQCPACSKHFKIHTVELFENDERFITIQKTAKIQHARENQQARENDYEYALQLQGEPYEADMEPDNGEVFVVVPLNEVSSMYAQRGSTLLPSYGVTRY